jgi:hypothetical protein
MTGTSKADFLVVAQFLYPAVPLPKVSWDNLQVLLVEGRKWDMQVRPAATETQQVFGQNNYGQQLEQAMCSCACVPRGCNLFSATAPILCLADHAFGCLG